MDPEALHHELERRGLTVLGVGQHRRDPRRLCVYLHGNDGQWVHGAAKRLIASVPGVVSVHDSDQTPTILVVETAVNAAVRTGHPRTDANPG
jgi:hypothetical protein